MSNATTKAEIVAAAAAKWLRAVIDEYQGPPEGLRAYLQCYEAPTAVMTLPTYDTVGGPRRIRFRISSGESLLV